MATNLELYNLLNDGQLKNRVRIACVKAANTILNEDGSVPNHANRMIWAKNVFVNTDPEARRMLMVILAASHEMPATNIRNASDESIQEIVDSFVDFFSNGNGNGGQQ
jgi:hypothetical protein